MRGGETLMNRRILRVALVVLCLIFAGAGVGLAADFPNKPITLIIPFSAGGSHDLNARVFSAIIHQYLGQPIVVKLMPGSGGQLGTAAAVKAKPDGYTLFYTHNYIDQLQPLIEKLPYDTTKALVTVCQTNYARQFMGVMKEKPWKTLDEVIDYARKNPGKLKVGHSGLWGAGFVPYAMLFAHFGAQVHWIGYKGGGPLKNALLAREIDFGGQSAISIMPEIKSGDFRPLAVVGNERHPEVPDVPSLGELGITDEVMHRIIQVPRATPADRIEILRTAFRKLNKDKTYRRMIERLGENAEYIDGPDYEKIRVKQKQDYLKLIKEVTGK